MDDTEPRAPEHAGEGSFDDLVPPATAQAREALADPQRHVRGMVARDAGALLVRDSRVGLLWTARAGSRAAVGKPFPEREVLLAEVAHLEFGGSLPEHPDTPTRPLARTRPARHGIPVPISLRDLLGRPAPPGTRPESTLRSDSLPSSATEAFERGVQRFDAARFFEAHELFEQVWRSPETGPADRPFWKGVTQVAVGFCHVQRGNARGALTLLDRAIRNLEAFPSPHLGVDTRALADAARAVAGAVHARGVGAARAFPPFPRAR